MHLGIAWFFFFWFNTGDEATFSVSVVGRKRMKCISACHTLTLINYFWFTFNKIYWTTCSTNNEWIYKVLFYNISFFLLTPPTKCFKPEFILLPRRNDDGRIWTADWFHLDCPTRFDYKNKIKIGSKSKFCWFLKRRNFRWDPNRVVPNEIDDSLVWTDNVRLIIYQLIDLILEISIDVIRDVFPVVVVFFNYSRLDLYQLFKDWCATRVPTTQKEFLFIVVHR